LKEETPYCIFEKKIPLCGLGIVSMQGYHTVLISKICPCLAVLRLWKYWCPYFWEMSWFV